MAAGSSSGTVLDVDSLLVFLWGETLVPIFSLFEEQPRFHGYPMNRMAYPVNTGEVRPSPFVAVFGFKKVLLRDHHGTIVPSNRQVDGLIRSCPALHVVILARPERVRVVAPSYFRQELALIFLTAPQISV